MQWGEWTLNKLFHIQCCKIFQNNSGLGHNLLNNKRKLTDLGVTILSMLLFALYKYSYNDKNHVNCCCYSPRNCWAVRIPK